MLQLGAMPLRVTEGTPSLFLVDEVGGRMSCGEPLMRHISEDISVYGLLDVALGETPLRTLQAQAARLSGIIKTIQPTGPYRLAGWSTGGILAYEIATQLIGEDKNVEFLALLDSVNYASLIDARPDPNFNKMFFLTGMREDADHTQVEQLITLAATVDFKTFEKKCLEVGIFTKEFDLKLHRNVMVRLHANIIATTTYCPQPISIPVHLFRADGEPDDDEGTDDNRDPLLGWSAVLPETQIQVSPVPGTHASMVESPNVEILGKSISEAILKAGTDKKSTQEVNYSHLMTIQAGQLYKAPVFCVPGAGANVAGFNDLSTALGTGPPIYGLQPRGLDGVLVPHSTVQAAAAAYLREIDRIYSEGPIHLFGHSFGGWVAYEMALQMRTAGRSVASLTIVDSRPPDSSDVISREYTNTEVLMKIIDLFEQSAECSLGLAAEDMDHLDETTQLELLHQRLVIVRMLPKSSRPEFLKGVLRTFAVNLRTIYKPSGIYPDPVRLVLAKDAKLDEIANQKLYEQTIGKWQHYAPDLFILKAPGNHMTILKAPYVDILVNLLKSGAKRSSVWAEISGHRGGATYC